MPTEADKKMLEKVMRDAFREEDKKRGNVPLPTKVKEQDKPKDPFPTRAYRILTQG